jgi:hypothetical protein
VCDDFTDGYDRDTMTLFTRTLTARVRTHFPRAPRAHATLQNRQLSRAPSPLPPPSSHPPPPLPPLQATQKLLLDLSDTDELAALWLNNFIADATAKPHTGDAFVAELLAQRTALLAEPGCPAGPLAPPLRELSPPELARRLLAVRKDMAARTASLPAFVEGANMGVLRAHLTRSTYVSGK